MAATGLYIPQEEERWLYRGVHGEHPTIAVARQGIVVPGAIDGNITPEEHNLGAQDDLARSPYTSWTESLRIARIHARKQPGGVVLRLPNYPTRSSDWSWENSPDEYEEAEVLLKGVRIDCEVLP